MSEKRWKNNEQLFLLLCSYWLSARVLLVGRPVLLQQQQLRVLLWGYRSSFFSPPPPPSVSRFHDVLGGKKDEVKVKLSCVFALLSLRGIFFLLSLWKWTNRSLIWINQWINQWTNEWIKEWIKGKSMHESMNQRMDQGIYEWINEPTNGIRREGRSKEQKERSYWVIRTKKQQRSKKRANIIQF